MNYEETPMQYKTFFFSCVKNDNFPSINFDTFVFCVQNIDLIFGTC